MFKATFFDLHLVNLVHFRIICVVVFFPWAPRGPCTATREARRLIRGFVPRRAALITITLCHCISFLIIKFGKHNCWLSSFKVSSLNFKLSICCFRLFGFQFRSSFFVFGILISYLLFSILRLSHPLVVFSFFNFEFQRFGFHVWFPICLFPILRLSHPRRRLRSFSIAARRFESRWVHLVLACFTWFCSASCRVRFNYVVPLCSFFIFNFENTCLAFRFQHVFLINLQLFNLSFLVLLFGFHIFNFVFPNFIF